MSASQKFYNQSSGKSEIKHLKSMWLFLKPYRLAIWGALGCLTMSALIVLGLGRGMQFLVDNGFSSEQGNLLNQALLILVFLAILLALSTFGRFFLVSWVGERVVADIRQLVYQHILSLSATIFENNKTGDLISRLMTDTTLLQLIIGSTISVALRNLLLLAGGFVMLAVTSLKLTALVLIVVPIVLVPIIYLGRKVRTVSKKNQEKIANLNVYANETIHEIRTVQAFTHEPEDYHHFGGLVHDGLKTAVQRIFWRAILAAIVITLVFSSVSMVLWVGGHDVLVGNISAGQLSAFIFYAIVVAGAVGALSEVGGDLQRAAGAAERLTEIMQQKSDIVSPENPVYLSQPVQAAIEFSHVHFAYPSRPDTWALQDIDLKIKPGEKLALVGPSGAGKTTFFQLLLRFYDPQKGSIMFDGHDIRNLAVDHLRHHIGLVAQDPVIFDTTVMENIRYGFPKANEQQIKQAADIAFATEFIEKMPQGFDTILGERGVRLSGGQRQRLAIARALLRNPPLLLLDEATSALDTKSEQMIQQALDHLTKNRTTIMIAHRLSTVRKADRICVINNGQITAMGTHQQLMKADGLYARLAELQFQPL